MNWFSMYARGIVAVALLVAAILGPVSLYLAKRPPSPPEACQEAAGRIMTMEKSCGPGGKMRITDQKDNDGYLVYVCTCPSEATTPQPSCEPSP